MDKTTKVYKNGKMDKNGQKWIKMDKIGQIEK